LTPVHFTKQAEHEVSRAARWYEAQREGLGVRFMGHMEETVRKITLNPVGYAPVIEDVRRANIKWFPLALWFRIDYDGSIVIACLHAKLGFDSGGREGARRYSVSGALSLSFDHAFARIALSSSSWRCPATMFSHAAFFSTSSAIDRLSRSVCAPSSSMLVGR
jgi:hypothetical protein